MSRYQAYPKYKASGVAWLGDVPEHWLIMRNRFVFNFSKGLTITRADLQDEGVPCINYGEIHSKHGFEFNPQANPLKFVSEDYLQIADECLLREGDFVFADTSEDFKGSGNFSCLNKSVPTFAGYHTIIAKAKADINYKFFAYVFDSASFRTQIRTSVKGVKVFSVSQAILKDAWVWFPKSDEQTTIANFLDTQTSKIDTLIAKQQRMIALLGEKRQALISHAVTKGLNPDAPMKDSGVEWLGEVPAHWEVLRLKNIISSLESGVSVNASDVPAEINELGVLKTSCVYTRKFRVEENKTVLKDEENRVKCRIRKGAIIISRMNTPELVGASALVEMDASNIYLPDRLWQTVFNENIGLNSKFVAFFMMINGFRSQISLAAEGASSSMQNIAQDDYLSIHIAFPNFDEQSAITRHLDTQTAKIDTLISKTNQAVTLLQERRSALISAAVTGKIDVRELA